MKIALLIVLTVGMSGVSADSHTLRYHYTAISGKGSDLPAFSAVGYVDDSEILMYNSKSRLAHPMAQWMEKNEEFWRKEAERFKGTEPICRHNFKTVMGHYNQTKGIHVIQVIYVCELRDDGSTAGYWQMGYDGNDFAYLDIERGVYMPATNDALVLMQEWNSPQARFGERKKNYLENNCIEELKTYLEYGREDLGMTVRPEVKVWGCPQSDGVMRLQCLVYGFHPRPVDVKWVRNGTDQVPSDEMSPVLPHPDGTYQIRVSVEVPTKEGDYYSCHVEHSSLEETLSVIWEPKYDSTFAVTIGAVICCLVIIAVLSVGVFLYKKRKPDYKTTENSDTSSDASNNPRS